ncbi:MAG: hypothetical protein AAF234_11630 [Pseudomonadota bacterium]
MQAAALSGLLGSSFKRGANEEAYRRAMHQHKTVQDRERRQKQDEARNDSAELGDLAATVVTAEQAETFRIELDAYQTATIEALEINREALDFARERLQATLAQAHTLDDGRRVFESEDGLRVFDEFGNELSPEIITPEEIPDHHPQAETYFKQLTDVRALETEQQELLEYQSDLDDAAERLDSGDLAVPEYDELRETLRESAPDAVRAHIPDMETSEPTNAAPTTQTALDLNLDAELANAIQPTIPGLGR